MKKVFVFDDCNGTKDILGGKGANLVSMKKNGLPIPNGMIITTVACNEYFKSKNKLSEELKNEIFEEIGKLEIQTGKKFNGAEVPLLVSVRSGAPVSMPGMMDTILNLGLNDEVATRLIKVTGKEKFVYESYIRFVEMFSEIVKKIDKQLFHDVKNDEKFIKKDGSIDYIGIIKELKNIYLKETKKKFPDSPQDQILLAVDAIFNSWNTERSKYYRQINNISDDLGTAVVIQEMVFGNLNELSGTGVAFTRNPSTGENVVYGEYLLEAQGEDIVAGIKTPQKIETLKLKLPKIFDEFITITKKLEKIYKDMQDIEFTVENGKLFILQTRNGKRAPQASLKIAVDLVKEKVITEKDAILMVDPSMLSQVLNGSFDEKELKNKEVIYKGIPGSAGVAVGKVAFCTEDIVSGEDWILVRVETSPEDIKGMNLAKGIVTVKGGATSHGAVVARGMGKCCIIGCENIKINEKKKKMVIEDLKINCGDIISIDGYNGNIYLGEIPLKKPELNEDMKTFMKWCTKIKRLDVRMNADTVSDIKNGKKFGAQGVGLCRTEHMFFEEQKIWAVREMILSKDNEERKKALKKLRILQKKDFYEIFTALEGDLLNVRLLDPPFHEFLPKTSSDIEKLSKIMEISTKNVINRINELKEVNPMIGHRGCRLAVTFPEIYEMQSRSIIEAAIQCEEEGIKVKLEIMIPFIGGISEFKYIKKLVVKEIEKVFKKKEKRIEYKLGTMMELPRACLIADEIALESEFFSFGTNDLTQTTYGISRDDSTKFIEHYKEKDILKRDPFQSIDVRGVGKLVVIATELGKKVNKSLKSGVCGEHGGDTKSIEFFDKINLDYISCSPFRVPIAIIASARAALINEEERTKEEISENRARFKKNKLKKVKK